MSQARSDQVVSSFGASGVGRNQQAAKVLGHGGAPGVVELLRSNDEEHEAHRCALFRQDEVVPDDPYPMEDGDPFGRGGGLDEYI